MALKVIVIGAGEVGFHTARKLASENKDVVVIDKDYGALKRIIEHLDVQTLEGSGSNPKILEQAGIRNSDIMLAVTDSDEVNIIACVFANTLAPNLTKLVRIRNEDYIDFHADSAGDIFDIGKVINPDVEVVKTIERLISIPDAEDISEFSEGKIKLIGFRMEKGPLVGNRLSHLKETIGEIDFVVAAIVRGERLIIPSGVDVIQPGDLVYFVCGEGGIPRIMQYMETHTKPIHNILIIGGGNIGYRLAQRLEKRGLHLKLIEKDSDRCLFLAQTLDKTLILKGDGTDQELLQEENVAGMDMVVSLTGNEETNILTSLLSKNLGAKKAVALIDKFAYFPLVRAIGIENTVSPRQSAIDSILRYMRRGKVISAASIKGEEAEALEAIALEKSDIVGKSLKELRLPKGTLVLSIQRGDEIIFPSGDSVIRPRDRIIIFSTRKNIARVEKELTVELERF